MMVQKPVLIAIAAILCVVVIALMFLTPRTDSLTAWASLRKQIEPFADECEANNGTVVVMKVKGSDDREFTCTYPDGTQDIYTFSKR